MTSVDFTSNPGSDRVYGPGDTIQVTVTFDQDVTVGYVNSKRDAAKLDLEIGGQTRTAHYARTDGNKVIFEYTVRPGDETPSFLFLRPNSLRLYRDTPSEDGSIRNSSGRDAVLDHYGLADNGHLVDTVRPEFASAQVSNDGIQVAVTFNEGIRSPAILRAFGVQTSLLQSLALDVRVDGEIAVRSNAAVSGDTVTLTVSEPITQGQTVTVSYDNLFIETGESIFEDLRGNSLLTFAEQPASNGSTVADVDRPGGGLALSRNDLLIKEGQSGTYTVVLTSQPAADVTVAIGDHPAGRATVSPTSLTFTADNWNRPQTVTISSTEDSNYLDRWVMLRHTATGDNYRATAAAWLILRDNYNLTTATANTPAAGSPTIGGTPEVGQTLTLDIASIADDEGLTNAYYTYMYQWLRNGAEIPEATDTSYTLVSADQGQTIKVKVSFTDDANNAESRTSAATVAVAPRPNSSPTGAPTINGTPQVRRTLTVDTSEIADADGMETAVFRYQWFATTDFATLEFHGENSPTYTLGPLSEGLAIKVKVSFTDDRGHSETLTSAATEAVIAADPNSEPTGLPTIDGTPQVGETLTADTSAIDDADGLTNVAYSYQWVGSQSVIDADTGVAYILTFEITDQTGSTYTLAPADEGWTFEVKVSFTDDADNQESLTSAATEPVAARPNTEATGAPTISGTPQVGETLSADMSGIDDADGLTNVSYRYQWMAGGSNIQDATSSSYLLTASEQGQTVQVKVTFTDDAANQESLTSAETLAVAARPNTAATGEPTISGTPQVGQKLTADTSAITDADGLTNLSYSYQWIRSDGNTNADIEDATDSTYEVSNDDLGQNIKVQVSFTDDAGNQESLTSEATVAVAAAPSRLTVSLENAATTHDGSAVFTFEIRFSEEFALSYTTLKFHAFDVTGGEVLNAQRMDKPSNIRWLITVGPDSNGDVTVVLPVTEDCAAQGAICTEDGRPLSNRLDMTVTGPLSADQNTEATGAPTISGTAQVGETLTADVSSIADEDGLTNVSYSYQWIRNDGGTDADIAGETASTHTLVSADEGKTIKVRVSFTDDAGNEETLTSAATAAVASRPNTPATGLPTISGTVQVDQTLTADTSGITDADGLTNVSYSYQWIRNDGTNDGDIGGQTGSTYTLVSADEGKTIKVRVSFTDDAGNQESLTSEATVAVAAAPSRLTVSLENAATTHDGSAVFTFEIRFSEEFALSYTTLKFHAFDVTGGEVLNAQRMDKPSNIRWLITVGPDSNGDVTVVLPVTEDCAAQGAICTEDGRPLSNRLDMTVTGPLSADQNTEATGAPTISGTAQVGETLTADVSSIADEDGLTNVSYSYQWIRNDGGTDADIAGETASTHTLVSADEGKTIKVRVSFTDDAGNEETLTSAATAAVASRPNTPATGLPTISGTAQVDETLTADTSGITDADGLTNVSYSYQWIRNDGGTDADIAGETASTHTLVSADEGKTIKVRVSFTDDAGNEETLTSAATAAVAVRPHTPATGLPTISGTAQVGKTLTANISGIADSNGLDNAEFSYQWLANDADIQNATDSTYTLTDDDVGKTIKVRVSFTDDRSNDETLTSAATDTVVAKPDSPDTDAPPRDPGATVYVTVGNTVTGEIEEAIEVDWFKVSLLASETYQIDMRGAWGGEWARIDGEIVWVAPGTLHDPKLLGVFSAANVLVPGTDEEVSGDDRGDYEEGKNSRITSFSPPADGYYYIAAAAEAAWTGTYELTVTVVADE